MDKMEHPLVKWQKKTRSEIKENARKICKGKERCEEN